MIKWPTKLRDIYRDFRHPLQMFTLYLGATAADVLSSMNFPKGFVEQNAFARHPDGSFWYAHALITNGVNTAELLLASAALYCFIEPFGRLLAKTFMSVPFLWFGWVHLDATFSNLLHRWPQLYQPLQSENINNLLELLK